MGRNVWIPPWGDAIIIKEDGAIVNRIYQFSRRSEWIFRVIKKKYGVFLLQFVIGYAIMK